MDDFECDDCNGIEFLCDHIAVVSISDKETQCMDCLLIRDKPKDFVSDFPEYDRG